MDRVQWITHRHKPVMLLDFSECSASQVEQIARQFPEFLSSQAPHSVLLLTDFTKASFNVEALRAIKEAAVFDKPFIKKSALLGSESLPSSFRKELIEFSRRKFPTFKSRSEALDWLVTD